MTAGRIPARPIAAAPAMMAGIVYLRRSLSGADA